MRNEFKYTRTYDKWKRDFTAAAAADRYAELIRPLRHLGLKCFPAKMLACTNLLVRAVMGYCQMDGRECESFLKGQRYRPLAVGDSEYCLVFELDVGLFGRILTDGEFTHVDFADLFDHAWPGFKTAGFNSVYIMRLDGKPIKKKELRRLQEYLMRDMYNDRGEEEVSVDVYMSEFEDTAQIYATENYNDDGEPLAMPPWRAASFIARFGR